MKLVNLDAPRLAERSWLTSGYSLIATEDFESMIHELRLRREIHNQLKNHDALRYDDPLNAMRDYCWVCSKHIEDDGSGHAADCPVKALEEMEGSDE